jgi:hypothetical protein
VPVRPERIMKDKKGKINFKKEKKKKNKNKAKRNK